MSLHKAIKYGKEHRVEYGTKGQPYCKSVDKSCRNHGDCVWCTNGRLVKNKSKEKTALDDIERYKREN